MERDVTCVTIIANNTAISCERLLYSMSTVDNNNTKIGTLFSLSDKIVEKLSSTKQDAASRPPLSTMTSRATAAYKQRCEYWTSWQNMTRTEPPYPLLTRGEILDVAKKLAHDRNWSVKLALAILQCRLDAERQYREADLAYSLLDEEITRGA